MGDEAKKTCIYFDLGCRIDSADLMIYKDTGPCFSTLSFLCWIDASEKVISMEDSRLEAEDI